ncbi:MAG: hypothetical protein HZY75_12560 [Nocardioidaceae bacterium]|nr:MAG: hypothetical protein HZY75_12560 [Nocardioidaceae bacterium]
MGRFRVNVTGLPKDKTVPVVFRLSSNRSLVYLQNPPAGCSRVSGDSMAFQCNVTGSFSGVVDMWIGFLGLNDKVTVTVTISVPAEYDSDPSNNRDSAQVGWFSG